MSGDNTEDLGLSGLSKLKERALWSTFDDLALADGEDEGLLALARGIEDVSVRESPDVVHSHFLALPWVVGAVAGRDCLDSDAHSQT
jgi:hypothetical protein